MAGWTNKDLRRKVPVIQRTAPTGQEQVWSRDEHRWVEKPIGSYAGKAVEHKSVRHSGLETPPEAVVSDTVVPKSVHQSVLETPPQLPRIH